MSVLWWIWIGLCYSLSDMEFQAILDLTRIAGLNVDGTFNPCVDWSLCCWCDKNDTVIKIVIEKVNGKLSDSVGNLVNLTTLEIASTLLYGTIPSTIGNLVNLQTMNLGGNQLSGTLPETIGHLTKLLYLDLSYNSLGGTIPLDSLQKIHFINLKGNQFTDYSISVTNLQYDLIDISLNHLTGTLPNIIPMHANLSFLSFQSNDTNSPVINWFQQYRQHPENFLNGVGLSSGAVLYDCDCFQQTTCVLTVMAYSEDFSTCNFPCSRTAICLNHVQYVSLRGFFPIYLQDYEKYVNISNSQAQIIGDVSLSSLFLWNSTVIVTGSLSTINGFLNLKSSNLLVNSTTTIHGSTLVLSEASTISVYGLDIRNTTLVVDYNSTSSSQVLINLLSNKQPVDLRSITLNVTNMNQDYIYSLDISEDKIVIIKRFNANEVAIKDVTGYSSLYLSGNQQTMNISNSQIQIVGNVTPSSFYLSFSSAILNGSLFLTNGTLSLRVTDLRIEGIISVLKSSLNLETSYLIIEDKITFLDSIISFGDNSTILTNTIIIQNTTLLVDFNTNFQSRELITYLSNQTHIDLKSIKLIVNNQTDPSCYHLQVSGSKLLVLRDCPNSNSPLSNEGLIGGLVGGVVTVVIVIGVSICIWTAHQDQNSLEKLIYSPAD